MIPNYVIAGLGLVALTSPGMSQNVASLRVRDAGLSTDAESVELRGLAAGTFSAEFWEKETLHWVPDIRSPLLEPREGAWRNIYAPSVVESGKSWQIYYGAWDGGTSGNDRIYATSTTDFLSFGDRRTVVEHGKFQHVCNVNALLTDTGTSLTCTVYPDQHGWNKPAIFSLPASYGIADPPVVASLAHIIQIDGYSNYKDADINGMNVLLQEGDVHRLYFCDFRNFGNVFRATSRDGRNYSFDGVSLNAAMAVNDVKKLSGCFGTRYLMGLHMNKGSLHYALSTDGMKFDRARPLFKHLGEADKYMVAVGWVTRGEQDQPDRRLLGILYGAGAVPSLDKNRIFARWLQKRLVINDSEGKQLSLKGSFGPDRQLFECGNQSNSFSIDLLAEDGLTTESQLKNVKLEKGKAYEILK